MTKLYTVALALVAVLALVGGIQAADDVKSGPQVGKDVPGPFHPLNVNGPNAGEPEFRYLEAQKLAEDLEMRPLQAHCHLALGKLYRRTGRAHEAHIELSKAAEMLRAMEMTFWLPDAESELARAMTSPSMKRIGI